MNIFKKTLLATVLTVSTGGIAAHAQTGQAYEIQSATGVGSHPSFPPSRVIDGVFTNKSRWAGFGFRTPEELKLDLGSNQAIGDVQIAWTGGSNLSYPFEIAGRTGTSGSWTTIFTGTGTGSFNKFVNYDVSDITARQIRIRGARDGKFTFIAEVGISAPTTPANPPPAPTPSPTPTPTPTAGGDFGLDPSAEPWENFDLDDWAYDSPAPRESDPCRAIRSDEDEWDEFRDSPSSPYFFTHTDGGMRFVSPVGGATTSRSCTQGFPRSELREMLRRGNTSISTTGVNGNNWALGYQPGNTNHGGRNGVLTATLRVNQVTTTGTSRIHPGRTIIGQIHADNDEPARLYYRKLPGAEFGCVYLESEIRDGDDVTFNLIGDERCDDNNDNGPSNGIRLDELFSYEIINENEDIIVRIRRGDRDGPVIAQQTVDLNVLNSGYDRADEWMYFKAGVYTRNNTGDPADTDIITFYRLENSHDPN